VCGFEAVTEGRATLQVPKGSAAEAPGERLRRHWERLAPLPFGRWIFSRLFGTLVPYTGTISAVVEELRPGYARMRMRDHRRIRNHLNSIHAIAIANLGEATSGLAMNVGLPANARAIVTGLSIEYLKKARGTLVAACYASVGEDLKLGEDIELAVVADISNAAGEVVARVTANWRVGLKSEI
jgi:acyl-coenzyme A thioesterase PaaI-like protein